MTLRDFIPREHGAWAMWIVPMLSAVMITRVSVGFIVLFVCFGLLYACHRPVVTYMRGGTGPSAADLKTFSVIFVPAILLGGVLVAFLRLYWLLLFGALEIGFFFVSVNAFVERDQRSFTNELATVAALTLSAPAAYYTVTGTLDGDALILYILNFLFFGSSVFYVKMRIELLKTRGVRKGEAETAFVMTLAYHIVLIALMVSAAIAGIVSPWILLAFVPMLFQVAAGTLSRATKMNFTRLGFVLVGQSAVFLVVIAVFLS